VFGYSVQYDNFMFVATWFLTVLVKSKIDKILVKN